MLKTKPKEVEGKLAGHLDSSTSYLFTTRLDFQPHSPLSLPLPLVSQSTFSHSSLSISPSMFLHFSLLSRDSQIFQTWNPLIQALNSEIENSMQSFKIDFAISSQRPYTTTVFDLSPLPPFTSSFFIYGRKSELPVDSELLEEDGLYLECSNLPHPLRVVLV